MPVTRLFQNWTGFGPISQNTAVVLLVPQLSRGNQKIITMKKVMIPSTMAPGVSL
jgi:hypothetical protein